MAEQVTESKPALTVRCFKELQDYTPTFEAMKRFTEQRDKNTPDELWLLQHNNVLTQVFKHDGQVGFAIKII